MNKEFISYKQALALMTKEFVPYEQSLELKVLGFDINCLAGYFTFGDGVLRDNKYGQTEPMLFIEWQDVEEKGKELNMFAYHEVSAPLYQQAFRWLHQKLDFKDGVMFLDTEHQLSVLKNLIEKVKDGRGSN